MRRCIVRMDDAVADCVRRILPDSHKLSRMACKTPEPIGMSDYMIEGPGLPRKFHVPVGNMPERSHVQITEVGGILLAVINESQEAKWVSISDSTGGLTWCDRQEVEDEARRSERAEIKRILRENGCPAAVVLLGDN